MFLKEEFCHSEPPEAVKNLRLKNPEDTVIK